VKDGRVSFYGVYGIKIDGQPGPEFFTQGTPKILRENSFKTFDLVFKPSKWKL
jgi:hypothetical protein